MTGLVSNRLSCLPVVCMGDADLSANMERKPELDNFHLQSKICVLLLKYNNISKGATFASKMNRLHCILCSSATAGELISR